MAIAFLTYLIWPSSSPPSKPSAVAERRERPSVMRSRLHRDSNGLARAFSMIAARTLGTVVIEGRVRDRHSNKGIANAEVLFTGPGGESSVLCDENGRYRAELLPGLYRSYAQAEGYVAVARAAPERIPGPVSAAEVSMPQEGIAPLVAVFRDQVGVVLNLSKGAQIRGRVVDRDGSTIPNALVVGRAADLRVLSGSDVSESDEFGTYELLVPAGSLAIEAEHQDYAAMDSRSTVFTRAGEVLTLDIVMSSGCIIEGDVVNASGESVPRGSFERQLSKGVYSPIGKITDGKVRFTMNHEGPVTLRAWPWKSPPSRDKEFYCRIGDHYEGETFVIPDEKPALTGLITDIDGAPMPHAFVDLFGLEAPAATQQERADSDGAFAFFSLPSGPYQLSVYVPGSGATVEIIDVPSTGVPLRLGGVGSILGRIKGIGDGAFQLQYRCAFALGEGEAARVDALSMPMQSLLVPVRSGGFRIDDAPACPIEGIASGDTLHERFAIEVREGRSTLLQLNAEPQ